ncbi:MAG: acyl--CoA ligase [Desulfobacula sp.]|uniref:class I adenylate-forming enzyme family protein n=1 Tax=Desulfobacula sp. TaxID=2593537 RepID=UPI0025C5098B|nr:class I adenylate-forming enzyme family protein [Desulfobacula sp.]MCD4719236.1 acyl--CoA ligase [Desulfobacula sp.]
MIITRILAKNALMYKDKTALVERTPSLKTRKSITWKEFYKTSNQVANALTKKGIQKGDKIVQLMTNCLEWLPIYFGILSSGAWAVPLNFRFESDKILVCTNTAEAKIFIFGEEFIEKIKTVKNELEKSVQLWIFTGPATLCPDWAVQYETFIESASGNNPPDVELNIEDDAALYFTSGTTGNPKAVLLTHKNLEHACEVEHAHHGQTHEDIFLCIPPLYHTGAKMHWMGSFLVGGKSILLKGVKPQWIIEAVSEEKCTIVWLLVPWAHDILIAIENKEIDLSKFTLSQWRLMHAGAQPVPPSLIENWKIYFPGQDYDTNYGLTESTGPGCVHLGLENADRIGPIGLPGSDWEAKIVDKQGSLLFGNESGELIIKGPGVMKEYYKNPEATAKALKDGWLYTGDIARYDIDGFIWLVDRKKDMIIYGGENIFPVEIENFFQKNKKIKDIAVIGIPDERLGEIPAGIISVKPGCMLCESDIVEFQQELPRYKQLKKIFFGDVPRNPTGKIEKPKLRRIYAEDKRKDIRTLLR